MIVVKCGLTTPAQGGGGQLRTPLGTRADHDPRTAFPDDPGIDGTCLAQKSDTRAILFGS